MRPASVEVAPPPLRRCPAPHLGVLDLLPHHEQELGQVVVLAGLRGSECGVAGAQRRDRVGTEHQLSALVGGQPAWRSLPAFGQRKVTLPAGRQQSRLTSLALAMTSLYLLVSAARR